MAKATDPAKHDSGKTSSKPATSDGKHSAGKTSSSTSKARTDVGKLLGYRGRKDTGGK